MEVFGGEKEKNIMKMEKLNMKVILNMVNIMERGYYIDLMELLNIQENLKEVSQMIALYFK